MLFNSMHYAIFFVLIVIIHFSISHRYRWILLLLGSYYFYMCWKVEYVLLISSSTLIHFICAIYIENSTSRRRKKFFLYLSLFASLVLLFSFKYFNFFNDSAKVIFQWMNISYSIPHLRILLPVGISFYTFQALSYTIDVYRGEMKAEKHLGLFALFVSFFPQLVAGPVERAKHLLPQFNKIHHVDYSRTVHGLRLILWGLYKKVVIADNIAPYVDQVYNHCQDYTGWPLILATILFSFQIYCDFSGYADIAVGSARVLGYDLMANFNFPLFARSIPDYWRRWHISMSTWFKDYIFIPLGGSRCVKSRWYLNIFIVFFLSGLWHGANWTFVIWGMLHGLCMILSITTYKIRNKIAERMRIPAGLHHVFQIFVAFTLLSLIRIFFRGNSIEDCCYIFSHLFTNLNSFAGITVSFGKFNLILIAGSTLILLIVESIQFNFPKKNILNQLPLFLRWVVYFALIFAIILFGVDSVQFIYFQF